MPLKYKWKNFTRHFAAVEVPELAILLSTSFVITDGSVSEQQEEEDKVKVRGGAEKQSW